MTLLTTTRRRIVDLYAIPLFVGLAGSGVWWVLTKNIWLGIGSLVGVLAITNLIFRALPALARYQQIRSSEIVQIFKNQSEAQPHIENAAATAIRVDILTIRGLGVIGLNDSLLRKPLKNDGSRRLKIRVLMLNPKSKHAATRAHEIGESVDAFVGGLNLGIERLRELKREGTHDVDVYLYSQRPVWRCIALDGDLFVSLYGESVEGHLSTMYHIDGKAPSSLGLGFRRMFDAMCDGGKKMV